MNRTVARTVRTLRNELEDEDPVRVSVVLVAIVLLTDSWGIVLGACSRSSDWPFSGRSSRCSTRRRTPRGS